MTIRRVVVAAVVVVAFVVASGRTAVPVGAAADTLPDRLTDQEFWKLSTDLSEQNGSFQSDNLISNEIWLQHVLNELLERTKPGGGVYLGVGPEQNFTYIAALKPKMVFITDIRRGNLHAHLMYKALFEMSADRADFVSRLFTKKRPPSFTAASSAPQLMDPFWDDANRTGPEPEFKANLQAIIDWLTKKPHTLPLDKDDIAGIEYVYYSFYWFGPSITYSSSAGGANRGNMATYHDLMVATDASGAARGFLASDANFETLKDLERRNLIVPLVGNFGGPKALRGVGQYIRDHGATVTAFYLSNVEQYLQRDGIWNAFCANVATMPLTGQSTFIRSRQAGRGGLSNELGAIRDETQACRVGG